MFAEDDDLVILEGGQAHQERADAAANRMLILKTAESLFAQEGVENVSMADIAQAAGVGKGTLYRRFANKGALCLALMDTQMRDFQNMILAALGEMAADNVACMEQLAFFLDKLVHFTHAHSPLLCEVQRAGLVDGVDDAVLQRPHFWQYMTVFGLLKTAAAKGEIAAHLDLEYLADALLAPLKVDLFRYQLTVRGFTLERISEGLRQLVDGLTAVPRQ
jgi:AcrR family transcriptional regulator